MGCKPTTTKVRVKAAKDVPASVAKNGTVAVTVGEECWRNEPAVTRFTIHRDTHHGPDLTAQLELVGDKHGMRVGWVWVDDDYRRFKLGTKLYEVAARYACRRWGKPLVSDVKRSKFSHMFWSKQAAKGRATCTAPASLPNFKIEDDMFVEGRGDCKYFTLDCPAPRSLAAPLAGSHAVRRKRRKR